LIECELRGKYSELEKKEREFSDLKYEIDKRE
jgi:hypothetical protein